MDVLSREVRDYMHINCVMFFKNFRSFNLYLFTFMHVLFNLKKYVKNNAHVEALICEAYIFEEISTFISYYFEPIMRTRINHFQNMMIVVNCLLVEIYQ
jgi:hypothetical protein